MKRRLSYANVMATIAVVLALGGSATAAVTLPRNSVGSKQIRNGQVRSGDIKNATVGGRDVKPGSLTGAHVADGSLGGPDVADGSLRGADVVDGSIGAADLANGAIGGVKVTDGSIRGADVGDGSIGQGDLANGAVRGAKIADDSVTGADVKESSLATVANASKLDGIDSTGFARSGRRVFSDGFSGGADELAVGVPGYGSFFMFCENNNTPGLPADDRVRYGFTHGLGNDAVQGLSATLADNVLDDGKTTLFNPDAGQNTTTIIGADRVAVDHYLRSRNGDRAIRISAWGFDDETSTTDCTGMIEAQILR